MSIVFDEYNHGYRIVSIALDEETKCDLLNDELDFIFVSEDSIVLYPDNIVLKANCNFYVEELHNYDVFELYPNGDFRRVFDMCSADNYFFITGKCNSNCIMCPSSEYSRRHGKDSYAGNLIEIAKHIPTSVNHLTITGGEPFLIGNEIFDFLLYLKEKFEYTDFLILTNGRIFSIDKYAKMLKDVLPLNCTVAIPVHAANSEIHDMITQSNNSFIQTITGIKRLLSLDINVELRIVVSSLNADDFYDIAKLIVCELEHIKYVSIIAMEMTGNAAVHKKTVWIPYKQASDKISDGILYLIKNGIDVKLYNFPLCTVKKEYWTLCEKSISSDKIRFGEVCDNCKMRSACGGVFSGTLSLVKEELEAII